MGFQLVSSWQTKEQAVTQYGPCIAGSIMQNDGYLSSTTSTLKPAANQDSRNEITQMQEWNLECYKYQLLYV